MKLDAGSVILIASNFDTDGTLEMRKFLIILGVMMLIGSQLAAASAQSRPIEIDDNRPEDNALEGEDALRATADILAESEGISSKLALEVFEHQEAMDQLQEKIYNLDPESYGGAIHDDLPAIRTRILIKGEPSREASRLVAGYKDVTLEVVEFSLADMERMANSAAASLERIGISDFSTGADIRAQEIVVEIEDISDSPRVSRELSIAAPVRLRTVDGEVGILDHSYGGGELRDGGVFECTSGFVVERVSDGVDGVLTAEHCHGLHQYRQTNGTTYNMSYKGRALKSLGDVEWHTTTHNEYDNFYYKNNSQLDVSGLKDHQWMDVGDLVCRYGRASGNGGCKAINQLFVSLNGYSSLIRVNPSSPSATLGDSGGPWYVGGTAWGIHSGRFGSNNDHVFSAVSLVDGNMGVVLRTS